MGGLPGRPSSFQKNDLRGAMRDSGLLLHILGNRAILNCMNQIDGNLRVGVEESLDFFKGTGTEGTSGAVLEENGTVLPEHIVDLLQTGDSLHVPTLETDLSIIRADDILNLELKLLKRFT